MKKPVEIVSLRKIDKIRRLANKELRLTKKSMGTLLKSSEYSGPIGSLCVGNCSNGIKSFHQ